MKQKFGKVRHRAIGCDWVINQAAATMAPRLQGRAANHRADYAPPNIRRAPVRDRARGGAVGAASDATVKFCDLWMRRRLPIDGQLHRLRDVMEQPEQSTAAAQYLIAGIIRP